MRPVETEDTNIIIGKDQPEYLDLPARKFTDGSMIFNYELSAREIEEINETGRISISVWTFNQPFQPILPTVFPGDFYNQEWIKLMTETKNIASARLAELALHEYSDHLENGGNLEESAFEATKVYQSEQLRNQIKGFNDDIAFVTKKLLEYGE